jgi:hypothetical protein
MSSGHKQVHFDIQANYSDDDEEEVKINPTTNRSARFTKQHFKEDIIVEEEPNEGDDADEGDLLTEGNDPGALQVNYVKIL